MENPIVSWLFETDAVRVCPEGQPFWYTSGKLGPFYINTQFLYGSEEAANALLTVIEQACAGDKLRFYDKVYGEIEKQLAACPIYRQLIDLMTEAARKMDVDFVSGGERRDFFFSMPVARKLGLGHLSIFKDLSSVYTDANGVRMPAGQASLARSRFPQRQSSRLPQQACRVHQRRTTTPRLHRSTSQQCKSLVGAVSSPQVTKWLYLARGSHFRRKSPPNDTHLETCQADRQEGGRTARQGLPGMP